MDKDQLIFAALVGSKKIETYTNLELVQNEISKKVIEPIAFLPFKNDEEIATKKANILNNWKATAPVGIDKQFSPLSFSIDDGKTWFNLPYEPLISTSGKNIIVRRKVAKWSSENSRNMKGTIKERWAEDDTEITITGVLIGQIMQGKFEDCYPVEDFERLLEIMTTSKEIKIACPVLEKMGINKIVIEDYSFPFTKGENCQAYEIRAYSDYSYNLLLEI